MSDDRVVSVQGLVKAYGKRRVVDGLDLDVAAGEIVGLIGANGAGKTTTVECIQGLRRPDAGTLRVFGLDPLADAGRLRGLVGSQLQSSGLPDRLRGGERQRLFLVLAVVNRPRLVILDELTQGLDPAARRGVWAAIDELRGAGTTVLLVTHELDEAEELCDRVVAMRAGRILDSGTPAELVDRYGGSATITFTLPGGLHPEALAGLPNVNGVRVQAGKATVTGHRAAIAVVGALLVQAGPVPADLSVRVPRLEDALVGLLETAAGPGYSEPRPSE